MLTNGNLGHGQGVSLYFHIPFCTHKCAYCHFYVIPDHDPHKQQLMEGFALEWQHWLPALNGKKVVSIYFGGGTPALLGAEPIKEILNWIRSSLAFASPNPEITLEANPENITPQLMTAYAEAGINRVSIGIQTLENQLLAKLERLHNAQKAIDAIQMTAEAGIRNISIDLMYDLPGQTLYHWQKTLEAVATLPITHLSLYNLTIEPHTVFFKHKSALECQLPDPATSLKMYETAIDMLQACGLVQYEISAFAKDELYSRHNVGYWIGRPFLGLGPSAFSYWEGRRFRNVPNLSRYHKALLKGTSPIDFEEKLSPESSRRELLAIHLRLVSGVNLRTFQQQHGQLEECDLETLVELQRQGLIAKEGEQIKLTRHGMLFYDSVASEIV